MTTQAVGPGRLVAGRYRVEDLLDEVGAVRSWRAVDEVLSRPVFVQTVPSDDPAAGALTAAARDASHVADPRFLQILDVNEGDGISYVVGEWVAGRDLRSILTDGPLDSEQAAALGREIAEALASAHESGVHHLHLEPRNVHIAPDGSVKIGGLATAAAMSGVEEPEPDAADAAGVGRILYAALTARWPGDGESGLDQPMRVDGRFASPRQVRPGVPRLLDEIVDRTLGNGERHHASALRTPAQIADALARGHIQPRTGDLLGDSDENEPPPAILNEPVPVATAGGGATFLQTMADPEPDGSQAVRRTVGVLVGAVFLAVMFIFGWRLLIGSGDETQAGPDSVPATTPTEEVVEEETVSESEPDETEEPTEEPTETEDPADEEPALELEQPPGEVGSGAQIDLDGSIEPAVEGVSLRVERRLDGGDWQPFPDESGQIVATTDQNGAFSTYVITSRQGTNDWRLVGEIDGEPIESNIVTVVIN
ncbi:MAG TPA: protein kinase family protein [Jiangellaceae bacterium]